MLVRLILCIADRSLQEHLRKSFSQTDLLLECFGHLSSPWQKVIRSCGDIIVVSRSMIPSPVEMGISMLNELPENPTTVSPGVNVPLTCPPRAVKPV